MFLSKQSLDELDYEKSLIAARSRGQFPDIVLRISRDGDTMTGGELIELKDSKSGYGVASFNSTIPTGKKPVAALGKAVLRQMGAEAEALAIREVYYLVRGRQEKRVKVCLTHGSFFETVPESTLLTEAFLKLLDESLPEMDAEMRAKIASVFTQRTAFSQTRDVKNASVKLRFRVMTEVKPEGNPLNSAHYPQIPDDSLNLIVPIQRSGDARRAVDRLCAALGYVRSAPFGMGVLKHPFNGRFLVLQCPLT
jgi:hypothetical protein